MTIQADRPQLRDTAKTFSFDLDGRPLRVAVRGDFARQDFQVELAGRTLSVRLLGKPVGGLLRLLVDNRPIIARIIRDTPEMIVLSVRDVTIALRKMTLSRTVRPLPATQGPRVSVVGKETLTSRIPGRVVKVAVSAGQKVLAGDTLVVLESMKMEAIVKSDREGVIREVRVRQGQSVSVGTVLVTFLDVRASSS